MPIEVTGPLGLNPDQLPDVERVTYGNQGYIRAADLTRHGIEVSWLDSPRTVFLRSEFVLPLCPGRIDLIMGRGATTEGHLLAFMATL